MTGDLALVYFEGVQVVGVSSGLSGGVSNIAHNNNPQGGTDPGGRSIIGGIAAGIAQSVATTAGNNLGTQSGATNPAAPSTAGSPSVDPNAVDPYAVARPRGTLPLSPVDPYAEAVPLTVSLVPIQPNVGLRSQVRGVANAAARGAITAAGGRQTIRFVALVQRSWAAGQSQSLQAYRGLAGVFAWCGWRTRSARC